MLELIDPTYPLDVYGTARHQLDSWNIGNSWFGPNKVTINSSANSYGSILSSGTLPLMINSSSGGIVSVGNSNRYTSPMNNFSGKMFVYGSGTSDSTADVFHVRENTYTNPHEIFMGYNTSGGYGVIQSLQHNISRTDLWLNPNGAYVQMKGFYLNGGTRFQNFYESTWSTKFYIGSYTSGSYTLRYRYMNGKVTLWCPPIKITTPTAQSGYLFSDALPTTPIYLNPDSTFYVNSGPVGYTYSNGSHAATIIDVSGGTNKLFIEPN